MRCSVCSHTRRAAIEEAITSSSVADAASQFGISERTLERHAASHPRAPAKTAKRPKAAQSAIPQPAERVTPARATSPEPEPRTEDDEEPPATSRSRDLVTRPRPARERLESLIARIEAELEELDPEETPAHVRLSILRALVSPIRLLGQLTGEVGASEATVAASPFYRRVRNAIVEALREPQHREALIAVIAALEAVEGVHERTTEAAAE